MKQAGESEGLTWHDLGLPCVLLLTGLLLIALNWFGLLSLERIQNLWPTSIILTGIVELVPVGSERRD
jgi:hypothetical protein